MIATTDLIVIGLIVLSGLWAFIRGFVREALGIASWFGAGLITLYGFGYVRPFARQMIGNQTLADSVAGIILFLFSLVILSLISSAISMRVRDSGLSLTDRTIGFIFGLVRGAALLCVAYYLIFDVAFNGDKSYPWMQGTKTVPLIQRGADWIASRIPSTTSSASEATVQLRKEGIAAADAAEALRLLNSPTPSKDVGRDVGKAPKDDPQYNREERRELDRLIQGK